MIESYMLIVVHVNILVMKQAVSIRFRSLFSLFEESHDKSIGSDTGQRCT